ncbi:MAG: inositol monophosphatase family protein [Thioalkalivibrionaceae bacterium]
MPIATIPESLRHHALARELATAIDAAEQAAQIIRHYYAAGVAVETKADDTPVTRADVESEQAIRKVLETAFPDDGFHGEETGEARREAQRTWLIDPIDGTKSFVRRYPFFSTQIALEQNGELVLGLSNAPCFGADGEHSFAIKGGGAYWQQEHASVSDTRSLARATLSLGNLASLSRHPAWTRLADVVNQVHRVRGYGDFYHYHLLARGAIDLVIESDLNILDIAALTVIVREAGGVMTALDGGPITRDTRDVLAAATPELHHEICEALAWTRSTR